MKKILAFLFIITLTCTLVSCFGKKKCTNHSDANGDLLCDVCGAGVSCTNHIDTKEDGVYKCDKCGAVMQCPIHKDDDANLKCDKCGQKLDCTKHVDADADNECDKCYAFVPCAYHVDEDEDFICDKCDEDIDCSEHIDDDADNKCDECESSLKCTVHIDADLDLECDKCGAPVACTSHVDSDKNLKCDKCGADVECTHTDSNNDSICEICGWDYDHTHSYSQEWSKDAENHWHVAVCGHNAPVADKAAHADEDNDGACDTCSWNGGHEHEYSTEFSFDATDHWYAPSCGHNTAPKDKAAHVDENLDGLCEVCSYQYCTHEFDQNSWTGDETGHWHPASCGHPSIKPEEVLPHTLDVDGFCTACGYDSQHEHTYSDEWSYTATEHWYESTCGHPTKKKDLAPHTDEENNDGICDVCGYQFCNHTYSEVHSYDSEYHWYEPTCGHSVEPKDKEAHVDENGDILCDKCPWNYGHEHTFNTDTWVTDETHHWHSSTCEHPDVKGDYEEHTDINWDFKCDICQAPYEDLDPDMPDDYDDENVIIMPPHYIGGSKS